MSDGERDLRTAGPITLDQLLALNEEIAALVRAGVPLDRGLLEAGRDVRGRLGRIAGVLGRRLNRGEGLVEAMAAEERAIPPLYRAVVEAGVRAGRLPAALEGLAGYIRGLTDARRSIGLALWYPGMVVCLAYLLFVAMVMLVVPRFLVAVDSLGLATPAPLYWLGRASDTAPYWAPIGPVLLMVVAALWFQSGTTAALRGGVWSGLRLFPWMGRLLSDYEAAGFSELLALLLEHRVPYPPAMVLAAEATGSPWLIRGARRAAEAVARGEPPAAALDAAGPGAFPPMLRWTLATGQAQGSLGSVLHHLAGIYRRRAGYRAEQIALFLPAILTLAVGTSVVAFYGLSLFLPLVQMMGGLSAG
jgi:type II secretory pathway component PulF